MITSTMDCLTCEQLTAEYEHLGKRYAEAREQLTAFSETSSARMYRAIREFTDDTRLEYEVARIELERHKRTHTHR